MKQEAVDRIEKLMFILEKSEDQAKLIKTLSRISGLGEKSYAEPADSDLLKETMQVQEKVAEAYEKAIKLVNINPRFAELKNLLELFKISASNWRNKAGISKRKIADNLKEKGFTSMHEGKYDQSIAHFDEATMINPEDPDLWVGKGNALYATGKYSEAIHCYDQTLQINPENVYALCNKGLALNYLGNHEAAVKYFDLALSKNPKTDTPQPIGGVAEMAHLGKGFVFSKIEGYEEAEKEFEAVLSINQRSVEALNGLSAVYHDGFYKYERAAKLNEQVLELDPHSLVAKANLSETLLATGNYGRSEQLAADILLNRTEEYGYPMRLVRVCILYFQDRADEAKAAALDLLEYYKASSKKQDTSWNFRGLKNIIDNKELPNKVRQTLLSFIELAKPMDQSKKIELVKTLTETLTEPNILSRLLMRKTVSETGQKNIQVRNTSSPDADNPGWYMWEIFLSPQEALDDVKNVTYTLHKTFPDPIRLITERETGFRLRSRGWGEFRVKVEICFNNDTRITKYHWLELGRAPLDIE